MGSFRQVLAATDAQVAVERLARQNAFQEALNALEDQGIFALTWDDPCYPNRWLENLGVAAPPVLFYGGNCELLRSDTLGIVGSRDACAAALEFADSCAKQAVAMGLTVISGGARGIDRQAMEAALESEGACVGVLSDSLAAAVRATETTGVFQEGKACLCSPFSPSMGFSVGNAMGRNKLVYLHGKATIVASCNVGTGGTWTGAVEALRKGYGPVLVWSRPEAPAANQALIDQWGATPLERAEDLPEMLERAVPAQSSLFS